LREAYMTDEVKPIVNTDEVLFRDEIHELDEIEEFIDHERRAQMIQLETELWKQSVLNDLTVDLFVGDRMHPSYDRHIPLGFKRYEGIGRDEELGYVTLWIRGRNKNNTEGEGTKRRGFLQRIIAALFG
jgi:hypothetical protein